MHGSGGSGGGRHVCEVYHVSFSIWEAQTFQAETNRINSPRIVTDYKCQKDGAIHCWTNGKDYGSCNMTEGLVTNDYFLVQVVETETCTPGAFIGML